MSKIQKIQPNEILFLIRSYNEATRIASVIASIRKAGYKNILVVNDGSRDATLEVLSGIPDIFVVSHPFNRGGGAALETWLEFVRRHAVQKGISYVVTFDADGQHDVADLPNFIKEMEKGAVDIIFGSRFIVKTKSNVPFHRRIVLFWGRIFTWFLSGIQLTDAHNGYRFMTVDAVNRIKLTMDGMEYASELIEQIRLKHLRFSEVPVNILYDEYSLSKGQKSSNAIKIAARMIWSKFMR